MKKMREKNDYRRIASREDLKEWLRYESNKYAMGSLVKIFLRRILGDEKATIIYFQRRLRRTEYYKNTNKWFKYYISVFFLNRYRNKFSLHIEPNVFGKGLKIMHLGPILTNARARAGDDVSVHINTALVARGTSDEVPMLGNNIVIGIGSTVLGGVMISDGIAIGANSLVNKDFLEKNVTIAGSPAKIISNGGRESWAKR